MSSEGTQLIRVIRTAQYGMTHARMLTALIAAGAARDLLARGPEIPVSDPRDEELLSCHGHFSHSAMPRPMIHSLSVSERKSSSSVKRVTTCL